MQDCKDELAVRNHIVLWRHPITTVNYFLREVSFQTASGIHRLLRRKYFLIGSSLALLTLFAISQVQGSHQILVTSIRKQFVWCIYWLGLGILSSVGLGTGLHTFLLYLGPHIAAVTIAASECRSVDFPEPPYPDEIICPKDVDPNGVGVLQIMGKVRWESMLWGAGTALGELPPYFMAKAARLSGCEFEDKQGLKDFLELQERKDHPEDLPWFDRLKLSVEKIVESVGFLGILACASIPNPLFDLAGITCGHFLVPFWTFFGATLLGKAVIKMHVQQLFVIFVFNETQIDRAVTFLGRIPFIGKRLQGPTKEFLQHERTKLHRSSGKHETRKNIIVWIFEKIVVVMILYFVISIVNSVAQNYHKRMCKERRQQKTA